MAARFPQSGSSVAYQIKAAYSSKIKALYWAAGADSVHRLRPGDTSSTIVTRSTSGAGFNADGRITGTNTTGFFSDSNSAGLDQSDDIVLGWFGYGDLFNGGFAAQIFATNTPPDTFNNGINFRFEGYTPAAYVAGGAGGSISAGITDDVKAFIDIAVRRNATDPINTFRQWLNGSEQTSFRRNATPANSDAITNLWFGTSFTGAGNSVIEFEGCFFASGDLTDAELAAITADPTVLIEPASLSATITLTDPVAVVTGSTASCTITRSTAASGNITYNLTSSATGVATVPATATILDGQTTGSFNITGVSAGSSTITATNAADSGETDSVTLTVTALTKKLKLLVHPDAQGDTGVAGVVFAAPAGSDITGAKLGEFTGKTFEASLESGKAVLKVPVTDFGGGALTTSDTPVALVRNATDTTGIISCTVIEE